MIDVEAVEQRIRQEVGALAGRDPDTIRAEEWVSVYGIDSVNLLLLRESVEQCFGVAISDADWLAMDSIASLARHVAGSGTALTVPEMGVADPSEAATAAARHIDARGIAHDAIEIGMSLTGIAGLAETPLLRYLGDLRWAQMSALSGVPSRQVVDADGQRLYAAFFHVDLGFPPGRPMTHYQENHRLQVRGTLARFGESMLDGTAYLSDPDSPLPEALLGASVDAATQAGHVAARMTNVFVNRHGGSQWLKRSLPDNPGFTRIPALDTIPDSYHLVKAAEAAGAFGVPADDEVPLSDAAVVAELPVVPERDLNGAGLVYFASFPQFLDVCERAYLLDVRPDLDPWRVHHRALARRRSAYLHNASLDDTLRIETRAWACPEDPAAPGALDLRVVQRMWRTSDERLMMISTARKRLPPV